MARAEEDRKTLTKTRVPQETLPKLDVGKQPAATIVVSSVPPPPQHRYRPQRQGNETTDRGLQLLQTLHDTRRVQPAVPNVLPLAWHRHRKAKWCKKHDKTRTLLRACPQFPSDPEDDHYDNYRRSKVILHHPFRDLNTIRDSDVQPGAENFTQHVCT